MMKRNLIMLFMVMAVVAAACGDTSSEAAPDAPGAGDADVPVVAGLCPEDEPDCGVDTDIVVPPDDAPLTSDGGDAVTGFVVDGGLTVSEALATDATGVLAVQGALFGDDQGWRLCEVLAESFPPQCGGASLPLGNFDQSTIDDLPDDENLSIQENQGITWSDGPMLLFGEIVDGTLMVDSTVAG